ncbi:MAG: nitroreductase family protein [Verrucomicrobiota bacterium]|nr:nitroreductase family protein [Verrucomicrobiota bacterium]
MKMNLVFRIWAKIRGLYSLFEAYFFDLKRFAVFSGMVRRRTSKVSMAAWLTMTYHRIEKGLSLRDPRLNFGEDVVRLVTEALSEYIGKYGFDQTALACWKCLSDYHEFHRHQSALNLELYASFSEIQIPSSVLGIADSMNACKHIKKSDILNAAQVDFKEFAFSRHSVRDFTAEPVGIDLIREAAQIAQRTPSVCNRQGWRLHAYEGEEALKKAIACQGGHRGFTESIQRVVIVTAEVEHFFSYVERNQGFIDGGLYAMSLVYALHSLGLATCCLNLSLSPQQERKLRVECGIGANEMPIMMIAIGHYPEGLRVASSERKEIDETLVVHN